MPRIHYEKADQRISYWDTMIFGGRTCLATIREVTSSRPEMDPDQWLYRISKNLKLEGEMLFGWNVMSYERLCDRTISWPFPTYMKQYGLEVNLKTNGTHDLAEFSIEAHMLYLEVSFEPGFRGPKTDYSKENFKAQVLELIAKRNKVFDLIEKKYRHCYFHIQARPYDYYTQEHPQAAWDITVKKNSVVLTDSFVVWTRPRGK